jgi:hypothetical protein
VAVTLWILIRWAGFLLPPVLSAPGSEAVDYKAPGGFKVEVGSTPSVTLWLNSSLKQPLTVDGVLLHIGEMSDLRSRKRIGAEAGWLSSTTDLEMPLALSPRASTTSRGAEDAELDEALLWKVPGPVVLQPGVNEVVLTAKSLPPLGTYVFERVVVPWGGLYLEHDQLMALDGDTSDLLIKQRQPPRRFSAFVRGPARRAVCFSVVPRPTVTTLSVLSYPILSPDSQHHHQLSVLIDTHADVLTSPTLAFTQVRTKNMNNKICKK